MSSQPDPVTIASDEREDIELPLWPFQDLRVASGMLLGTEDFHLILGNPRGKMRLHQSWLHGSGVVWGLPVTLDEKDGLLRVGTGLAVDGWGRELRVEQNQCLSLREWATKWLERHLAGNTESTATTAKDDRACRCAEAPETTDQTPEHVHDGEDCGCQTHHACVCVVVRADLCLDRPVPALADPCDTARGHNEESRVLELARVEVVDDPVVEWRPYPRVRALFGIDPDSSYAAPGGDVAEAAARVAAARADRRAAALLTEVRCLAARDVTEARPPDEPGTKQPGLFPTDVDSVPVLLAKLRLDVGKGGYVRLRQIDECVRRAVLPTSTIQDLLCGDATAVLGEKGDKDAGGPRLDGCLVWANDRDCFTFRLTDPAAAGSQERAVEVSSLSDNGKGWAREECRRIRLSKDGMSVTVDLEHPPSYPTVRVIIRGTGRTPLYGRKPRVPFAGRSGAPPGTTEDGHDAVVTEHFESHENTSDEEQS